MCDLSFTKGQIIYYLHGKELEATQYKSIRPKRHLQNIPSKHTEIPHSQHLMEPSPKLTI